MHSHYDSTNVLTVKGLKSIACDGELGKEVSGDTLLDNSTDLLTRCQNRSRYPAQQ